MDIGTNSGNGDGGVCAGSACAGHEPKHEPSQGSDRRVHPRIEIDAAATLQLLGQDSTLQVRIADLSLDGCRLRARRKFAAGTRMPVEVVFRVNGIAFRRGGVTEWSDGWNLLGLRFAAVPATRAATLAEVIAEVENERLARCAQQADAEQVARLLESQTPAPNGSTPEGAGLDSHQDSQKDSQQLAQVSSLIADRSRDRIHAVAEQPESPSAHSSRGWHFADGGPKRERRAQPRHRVDASASIILLPGGSRLGGWIQDLCAEGCRIRTDARLAVETFTRVETEFRIEGLPFRLGGVVQRIHDRRLVGIHFLGVSDRKRVHIQQLLAEIDRTTPA